MNWLSVSNEDDYLLSSSCVSSPVPWVYIHSLPEFSQQPHGAGFIYIILHMCKLRHREMSSWFKITQLPCGVAGTSKQV